MGKFEQNSSTLMAHVWVEEIEQSKSAGTSVSLRGGGSWRALIGRVQFSDSA